MSSLTEEQRRRIEENRLKALQRRAQSSEAKGQPGTEGSYLKSNLKPSSGPFQNGSTSFKTGSRTPPAQPSVQGGIKYSNPSSAVPKTNNIGLNGASKPQTTIPSRPTPVYSGPIVTGTCRLISKDRFVVDMGYHSEVIKLLKNINGSRYDPSSRKWNFPLSEHNKVIAAIDSLKPQATVCPLPSFILRVFKSGDGESSGSVPEYDLSRIDPVLVRALLPFQREGVNFGISREGRVLIADDMGLGKTIQALGVAHYYYSDWPLLITTPSSMRYTWRDAIWNWLPSVPGGSIVVVESKQDYILDAKVLILSYDLLQRRAQEIPVKNCKVIIMDESHHLKNWKAARSKAAIPLLQNCKRAILLSGTPALSRPIELFTQLTGIKPFMFPNVNDFIVRYCNGKKTAWGWDSTGASNMEELQLLLQETVMVRRLKSDVLSQLPSKRRQVVVLDPSLCRIKSNKGLLNKANAFASEKKKTEKHGKLLEYFSETGKAKLEAVSNYVKDLVESGKKFLCFAHHRHMLDGICATLEAEGTKYIRIDGSTASEERKRLCDLFQYSGECLVAVLSITAANAGITLTAASLVVFAELFWNPGVLTQAEDRAHRIGQEDCVIVQYLVAKGTADDDIWTMVVDKLEVLSKAGLSKDNFRDAKSEAVQQRQVQSSQNPAAGSQGISSSQKQRVMQDFFQPVPSSQCPPNGGVHGVKSPSEENVILSSEEEAEMAAMLDNLPDDEFNDEEEPFRVNHSRVTAEMTESLPEDSLDAVLMNEPLPDDSLDVALMNESLPDDSLDAALMNETIPDEFSDFGDDDDNDFIQALPTDSKKFKSNS